MTNKGFAPILVILGLVIIAAIGGGAYFVGKKAAVESHSSTTNEWPAAPTLNTNSDNETQTAIDGTAGEDVGVSVNAHVGVGAQPQPQQAQHQTSQLPTSQYIGINGTWPPTVQHSTSAYSCGSLTRDVFDSPMTLTGTQKTINHRTYCVYSFSDGGAGHYAGVYTYITAASHGGGTERVDFRVDWGNCGVYGGSTDPQVVQCRAEQANFFASLDAAVDSLM